MPYQEILRAQRRAQDDVPGELPFLSKGHQNNPAMFYANPIIKPAAAIALDAPAIQQRPQAAP